MELSNGRAAEGGESTLWCAGGGGARHYHLWTADEYNNLIQLQSLVSIREDVQKVTRGLFVLNSWWIFFQL